MRVVPVDSETELFAAGRMAPRLVCIQFDEGLGAGPEIVTARGGATERLRRLLLDPEVLLVGHNISYDAAVWCAAGLMREVFAAYRAGRIVCTWVFERLGEISGHTRRKLLDLATCCKAHRIPVPETKGQGLELQFGQFVDSLEIPEPWRSYALNDLAVGPLFARQKARFKDVPWRALTRLSYRQFCLQLLSVWGVTADEGAVAALERDAQAELDALTPLAREWGFIRADGSRNMREIEDEVIRSYAPDVWAEQLAWREAASAAWTGSVRRKDWQKQAEKTWAALGPVPKLRAPIPLTAGGAASTAALTLEQADSPRLTAFRHYGEWLKTLTNDVPNLRASGTGWISTRYGMADTLRTTSSGDKKGRRSGMIAMQNMRQGAGIRECIRPRPGMAFYDTDASGLELCSLAQCCVSLLGRRGMADAIRQAGTPGIIHTRVAAKMARQSEADFSARNARKEPEAVSIRTRAKNAVFGYMGGLGAGTFVDYIKAASKGKIVLSLAESKQIKQDLFAAIPDIQAYLKWVGSQDLGEGTYDAELPGYGITRRGIWYAAAANNRFQALAAAAMTEVIIDACEACFIGDLSPCRPCLFIHDELLFEVPEDCVHEFDLAFDKLARDATLRVMPDVPTVWEAEATDRFSKRAKRVVQDGVLQVWRG